MTAETQGPALSAELNRLKQDFATRKASGRMSHSVAVAYRQVIANYEQITKSAKDRQDPQLS